ncbi:MAG TPA: peptidoglycan-binding domain-containing protein [Polyangiaceae bacterium]|nr:peptidoglycan-binding domain-containing protein [Polyangiaceae bacterium]
MFKSQIRTRFLLTTAALTLAPALALAADPPRAGTLPGEQRAPIAPEPTAEVPSHSTTAMDPHGSMGLQQPINSADVQKVFGMDTTLVELKSLNREQIKHLQQTLLERGHYRGPVDGLIGPKTRSGLTAMLAEQFAMNQRLINQGQITGQMASTLGLDSGSRTPVSGVDSEPNPRAPVTPPAQPVSPPAQPGSPPPSNQ